MDANVYVVGPSTRFRGLTLGALALLMPLACWVLTTESRTIPSRPQFSSYLVSGASWVLVACSCWAATLLIAVLVEELGGPQLRGTPLALLQRSCPTALRRFVLAWCGLAISTGLLAPAQAEVPNPQPPPLPSIGRVLDDPQAVPAQPTRLHPVGFRTTQSHLVTVKPGDSLWALARAHLGDGRRWPEIYRLNKALVTNPDLIEPGWKLQLPDSKKITNQQEGPK